MKIAIDVNGVLRDTILKIEQVYQKNFIDGYQDFFAGQTYKLDSSGNTEENETIVPFKYEMNLPVTSMKLEDHFKFESEEEYFSFLYEEYTMEIFGHAGSTELSTFNNLNDIYNELRDEYDFMIVSNEIGKSKPATLFFLSKFGCLLDEVKFYNNLTKSLIWNQFDILLTANPDLLLNYPLDKVVIKFETKYNEDIEVEHKINSIKQLPEILKTIKL
jgi:hypothetical protein